MSPHFDSRRPADQSRVSQAYQCDVSDQEAIVKLFREIYHDVGPVGGVVCSAGMSTEGCGRRPLSCVGVQVVKPALDMKRDDFRFQMEGNVWGCLTCAQAAAACVASLPVLFELTRRETDRLWKEHGYQNGRIVFVSCTLSLICL